MKKLLKKIDLAKKQKNIGHCRRENLNGKVQHENGSNVFLGIQEKSLHKDFIVPNTVLFTPNYYRIFQCDADLCNFTAQCSICHKSFRASIKAHSNLTRHLKVLFFASYHVSSNVIPTHIFFCINRKYVFETVMNGTCCICN